MALLPQLTPATDLGAAGIAGYAAREGVSPGTYAERFQPVLAPAQVAQTVLDLAGRSGQRPGVSPHRFREPCPLTTRPWSR